MVFSQGDRNWQGGTTFGSQNQSGGTKIFVTGPLYGLQTGKFVIEAARVPSRSRSYFG